MSDETQNTEAEADEQTAEAAEAAEAAAEQGDAPEDESPEVEVLEAENGDEDAGADAGDAQSGELAKDLQDKLLRTMAELENTRRIAAREKQDAGKYAVTNFARDMLRVADNLGFAMMSVSEEAREKDQNLDNLYVGIDMTMKELLNVFADHGIKPVAAEGKAFDHNVHEAVQQVEDETKPEGTVTQVVRRGFTIQDRLLRPAQVVVSKGGPKAEKPDANGDGDGDAGEPASEANPAGNKAYEGAGGGTGSRLDQET